MFPKNIPFKKTAVFLASQLLLLPMFVLAAGTLSSTTIPDVDLEKIFGRIGDYFFGFVLIACVFVILWSAFNMVTAGDDETKVASARKMLLWAFIGVILAASAKGIVGLITTVWAP